MIKNIANVPKRNKNDVAHAVVKIGLSGMPFWGGSASELFNQLITPSLDKRREKWFQSLADELNKLIEKIERLEANSLFKNEDFVSAVLQASQIALRNHRKEKLNALKNAILNVASEDTLDKDLQITFLGFIDTLSPSHLKILMFFNNPKGWFLENKGTEPENLNFGGPSFALEHAFEEFQGQRDIYDPIVRDLYSRGLFSIDQLHTTMTDSGSIASRTTELGRRFVKFISHPEL